MSIKIRFHPDNKAIIRWKTPAEREFLKSQMTMFRDSMTNFAKISVKDEKGDETPKFKPIVPPSPPSTLLPQVPIPQKEIKVEGATIGTIPSKESIVVKLGEEKKDVGKPA